MSGSRTKVHIAVALLLLTGLIAASYLLSNLLPSGQWVHLPLHSVAEAGGVLAAFFLAGLILQLPGTGKRIAGRRLWVACGLITIGVLDLFHATVPPGNRFVWLHSMSLLAGGFLFALAWFPEPKSRTLPFAAAVCAATLSVLSILFPEAIPLMISDGGFTRSAIAINLIGGGLFLLAMIRFVISYDADSHSEDLMFAVLALLFALSGILFENSRLWNADWWLWHLFRLSAYLVVAVYVLWVFQRTQLKLERTNEALTQEISYRKHNQEMLLKKSHELQRTNAELEEFAYIASHDLKAPLRAVANLAKVIDEDASGLLDEENRRRLRLLRERVITMHGLIDGLLDYARLGRKTEKGVPVALDTLLEELLGEGTIPPDFRVEVVRPLPTLVASPLELRQIFQNLIMNAIAHHDRAEGHVWIRAREEPGSWCLEVADDGPGIPESERKQIFRMFSSSKAPHTGIGLAVVRKLVLANGGEIEVAHNLPRGALFRIQWPKSDRPISIL